MSKGIPNIQIDNKEIGPGKPIFTIAEIGLSHEGSLGTARAFIDAAAEIGVDAIKFQTHIASAESTPHEPFRTKIFVQDKTRYDYWKRTEFTKQQWIDLAEYTRKKGIVFLSSPFSFEAMDILLECKIPAWKVASGEVCNLPMLKRMTKTKLPILLSSGMSGWDELDVVTEFLEKENAKYALLQCNSTYPCPPEKWGLNIISEMGMRYNCPMGLSDHSGSTVPLFAAAIIGASLLEFHIAFHPKQFGPDVKASLMLEQAKELITNIKLWEKAKSNPVDKDKEAKEKTELRDIFTKSVVPSMDLHKGDILSEKNISFKKPGTGIAARFFKDVLGKKLKRDVKKDELIVFNDLE